MTLSSFTGFTPLARGSEATAGLFNRVYSTISLNLDQLNSDVSTELDDKVGSDHSHDDIYYRKSESDASYAAASHEHAASDVTSGTFADARIGASSVTQHQGQIDHDQLSGFVANEHVDHSGVQLGSGTGLSGGGDLTSSRTLSVDNYANLARLDQDEDVTGQWEFSDDPFRNDGSTNTAEYLPIVHGSSSTPSGADYPTGTLWTVDA